MFRSNRQAHLQIGQDGGLGYRGSENKHATDVRDEGVTDCLVIEMNNSLRLRQPRFVRTIPLISESLLSSPVAW